MRGLPFPSSTWRMRRFAGTNPAANSEVSETVPTGYAWLPLAVQVALVQGATQTPLPILYFDDGTTVIAEFPGTTTAQAVSTTANYTWTETITQPLAQLSATPNIRSGGPLAPMLLLAGYRIRTTTVGIGANTDYGAPSIYVVEFVLGGTYP